MSVFSSLEHRARDENYCVRRFFSYSVKGNEQGTVTACGNRLQFQIKKSKNTYNYLKIYILHKIFKKYRISSIGQ
jgi:hypothetical protein